MRRLLVLLPLLLGACRAPLPPVVIEGVVRVRACDDRHEEATQAAALFVDLNRRVCEALSLSADAPAPELWFVDDQQIGIAQAVTTPRALVFARSGQGEIPFILAHELVHWHAARLPARLPLMVEEGLCDIVAAAALCSPGTVPCLTELVARMRLHVLPTIEVTDWERALAVDSKDWCGASAETDERLRAVGYVIARDVGLAGLLALIREADGGRVSPEQVRRAWCAARH